MLGRPINVLLLASFLVAAAWLWVNYEIAAHYVLAG
jgi:hypothetical protein